MSEVVATRKSPGNPAVLDKVGEDEILARIANGEPAKDIAASYDLSRASLYKWLDATPERKAKLADARRQQALSLVEEAGQILDEAKPLDAAEASIIRARADHRKWMASKLHRELFGDQAPGVNFNLNIQSLHLEALRQVGSMTLAPGPVLEAEIIEEAGQ